MLVVGLLRTSCLLIQEPRPSQKQLLQVYSKYAIFISLFPCFLIENIYHVAWVDMSRILQIMCRACVLARLCGGHTRSCCGESSCDFRNFFDHQAMRLALLFPASQSDPHIQKNPWPGLHSRNQLDLVPVVLGRHHWIPGYNHHRQCIWYVP